MFVFAILQLTVHVWIDRWFRRRHFWGWRRRGRGRGWRDLSVDRVHLVAADQNDWNWHLFTVMPFRQLSREYSLPQEKEGKKLVFCCAPWELSASRSSIELMLMLLLLLLTGLVMSASFRMGRHVTGTQWLKMGTWQLSFQIVVTAASVVEKASKWDDVYHFCQRRPGGRGGQCAYRIL